MSDQFTADLHTRLSDFLANASFETMSDAFEKANFEGYRHMKNALKAVSDEPEMPGKMPTTIKRILVNAIAANDWEAIEEIFRHYVRAAKANIEKRIQASSVGRGNENHLAAQVNKTLVPLEDVQPLVDALEKIANNPRERQMWKIAFSALALYREKTKDLEK